MRRAETLFDLGEATIEKARCGSVRNPLMQRAVRNQAELPLATLDDRVAKDHPVRAIAAIIERLDLRVVEERIRANSVDGGRPAIDPRILMTLWMWGISEGECKASVIARRTLTDDVYRWICGGVEVSTRSLAGFRHAAHASFESMFAQIVGALMSEKLIELHRIAQDGMRVRAWSGADSFHRAQTLEKLLEQARSHYREVMTAASKPQESKVERKAAERGAKERMERIERALSRATQLAEGKSAAAIEKAPPRASTTDPEATRMKMADGGFRPAYNVQFATTADGAGAIVGVSVKNGGNDFGELGPMLDRIEALTGERPKEALVDGGYVKHDDIEAVEKTGTKVYAPEPKTKVDATKRAARGRSAEVTAFYERIESAAGKEKYAQRGEVAELTNAHARSRFGLSALLMRGLKGALTMALMIACAKNISVLVRARSKAAADAAQNGSVAPAPERGA